MTANTRSMLMSRAANAWPLIKRVLVIAVVLIVVFLLFNLGRKMDWPKVWQAAQEVNPATIALSAGLVCIGYLVYASFDVLARRYAGHTLPAWKVLGAAAISYGINQSLGVLVGGIGARLRLYLKLGVSRSSAIRVVLFSTVTNWLGYCWLAGSLFVLGRVPVPEGWDIGSQMLRVTGGIMLVVAVSYLIFCGVSNRRMWKVRGHRIELPSLSMALSQSGLSVLSWSIMAAIIYILLGRAVPYTEVFAILLFCSIAAVMTHIPGGLGVTEAIFVAALAGRMPGGEVLASLLMYRVLYALGPLCIALAAYLTVELRFSRHAKP